MPDSTKNLFNLRMNRNRYNGARVAQKIRNKTLDHHNARFFCAHQGNLKASIIGAGGITGIDRFNHDEVQTSMDMTLSRETVRDVTADVAIKPLKYFHPGSLYKDAAVFARPRDPGKRLHNP